MQGGGGLRKHESMYLKYIYYENIWNALGIIGESLFNKYFKFYVVFYKNKEA